MKKANRASQADRILAVLMAAKAAYPDSMGWVSGLTFATTHHILSYSARIYDLRNRGVIIQTRTLRGSDGTVRSFFRLVSLPGQAAA